MNTASAATSSSSGAFIRSARASSIAVRAANRMVRVICSEASLRMNPGARECSISCVR
ncbi:hypothetical protein SFUMM280S_07843 [Streptomyces fumanus]